jgi:phospholipid-binding lipoprotein MlaA
MLRVRTVAPKVAFKKTQMTGRPPRFTTRIAATLLCCAVIAGCASVPPDSRDARDPFESVNRGIYRFNERVDRAVLRPTARAYRTVVPQFVRTSVSNVFSNIKDVRNVLNNTLQGKFTTAYSDFGRIAINSTLGVLGLFDIASEAGIEKHDEDFGQTLGWWGMGDGPFIMLPLFGPSSGRDTVGWAVDIMTDPTSYIDPTSARYEISGGRIISRRAELLDTKQVLDAAALDPYVFLRDAYLQRRRNLVYDGNPPLDKDGLEAAPKAGEKPSHSRDIPAAKPEAAPPEPAR